MGVFIKNMEKPKDSCWECKAQYNSVCSLNREYIKRDGILDDCPLLEIDLVTCKECKYCMNSEYFAGEIVCKYHIGYTYYTEPNRFCFWGKRRTDEHTD